MAEKPTPPPVTEDEAMQEYLAARREMTGQPEPLPAAPAASQAVFDPTANPEYAAALREGHRFLAADLKAQAEVATGRRKALPPVAPRFRNFMQDPTIPSDEFGNDPRDTKRWMYKWVPLADSHSDVEHHSKQRLWHHERQGFEVVHRKDKDGNETTEYFESEFGVLMKISPRLAAERELALAPAGAIAAEDYFAADVEEFVRDLNAQAGTRLMGTWREPGDHGEYQSDSLAR